MNRVEIKEMAKKKLEGNMWNIWQVLLIVMAISILFDLLTRGLNDTSFANWFLEVVFTLAITPLSVGLCKYYLDMIRGKKFEVSSLFDSYKKILPIVAASILCYVIIAVGLILLIVPGIIAGLALAMVYYVFADGEEDPVNVLKKSYNMMDGYKWDYFVFGLSFIGWILLSIITLGIALIWVYPYMIISFAIYYDQLKQKTTAPATEVKAKVVEDKKVKSTTKKTTAKKTTTKAKSTSTKK